MRSNHAPSQNEFQQTINMACRVWEAEHNQTRVDSSEAEINNWVKRQYGDLHPGYQEVIAEAIQMLSALRLARSVNGNSNGQEEHSHERAASEATRTDTKEQQ